MSIEQMSFFASISDYSYNCDLGFGNQQVTEETCVSAQVAQSCIRSAVYDVTCGLSRMTRKSRLTGANTWIKRIIRQDKMREN